MAQRGRSAISIAQLLKAGLLKSGQELRLRGPGDVKAWVTATGTVEFNGREYRSPSTAAKVAKDGTSTNGWIAWQVHENGRWIHLADLRPRLAERDV